VGRSAVGLRDMDITDPADPRIADYRVVSDAILLERRGLFVAEGRLVVRHLLDDGRFRIRSLLVTPAAGAALRTGLRTGDGSSSEELPSPTYVISPEAMKGLTGFNFHRGCLALVERPAPEPPASVIARAGPAGPVVVLEEVTNADNVGGVFRNARALGAGAVLLSPGCCDPLYRKAIRTSTAATLLVPFARLDPWPDALAQLRATGFVLVGLTPRTGARDLDDFADDPARPRRVALLVGTEGGGLSAAVERTADVCVRISMAPGVDSLNLATATGIALYRLAPRASVPVPHTGATRRPPDLP